MPVVVNTPASLRGHRRLRRESTSSAVRVRAHVCRLNLQTEDQLASNIGQRKVVGSAWDFGMFGNYVAPGHSLFGPASLAVTKNRVSVMVEN